MSARRSPKRKNPAQKPRPTPAKPRPPKQYLTPPDGSSVIRDRARARPNPSGGRRAAGDGEHGVRVSVARLEGFPRLAIRSGLDVQTAFRKIIPADDEREHFAAIYLDGKHVMKGWSIISIGTLSASLVHPREVFRLAILLGAAAIVVAHNHPSGDPSPSREDVEISKRLKDVGDLIGITLLDHVVLGMETRYVSLRERGLM